jgi:catechol 2,3-dioxygenase-like lactoylglutathione lyase family enzyme
LVYLILPLGPTEGSLENFMPKLDGILETAIHTEDMVRAPAFYEGVLGLEPIYSDNRLSAYAVGTVSVLVLASPPRRSPRFGGAKFVRNHDRSGLNHVLGRRYCCVGG